MPQSYISRDPSRYFHWDGTNEITLADFDAAMTEDVVGGGDVKVEVWQYEVVEVIDTSHVTFDARAKRESDLAVGGLIDVLGVERLHKGNRLGNARLEFCDCLLVVLIGRRVYASEPCTSVLSRVAGALHLTGQCKHVGEEARVEQHRRVKRLRFGIGIGLVEERRERVETNLEYRN